MLLLRKDKACQELVTGKVRVVVVGWQSWKMRHFYAEDTNIKPGSFTLGGWLLIIPNLVFSVFIPNYFSTTYSCRLFVLLWMWNISYTDKGKRSFWNFITPWNCIWIWTSCLTLHFVILCVEFFWQNVVRNWYARFSQITNNAKNLVNNAEEAAKALKEGTLPWCHCVWEWFCTSKMLGWLDMRAREEYWVLIR